MTTQTTWQDGIAIVRFENPPVNALGRALRAELAAAITEANAGDARAIVLVARGRMFSAGADINELGDAPQRPLLPELLAALEANRCPVVAFIEGGALGGGCELALACHARIASAEARFALPEVRLGLIPGAGGTQRLPRLIGVQPALDVILSGRTVDADEAARLGLVDQVMRQGSVNDAIQLAARLAVEGAPARGAHTISQSSSVDFAQARQNLRPGASGLFAQERVIAALEAATLLPLEAGLVRERELFVECRASPESAALRYQFFAERHAADVPGVAAEAAPRRLASVGIVGAGAMGSGIAIACASAGLSVSLLDSSEAARTRGLGRVRQHFTDAVARGRISAQAADAASARVIGTAGYEGLAGCDLVIEAVIEDPAVKADVFTALDRACPPGTVLATNTSTLDIDALAAKTARPAEVLGLHFFSPANVMPLLEIVRGRATSSATLATARRFARLLGKVGVVAGNCFGFIGNRMLQGYMREALTLVLEGAEPSRIDALMRGFGFPMGPLEVRDLAGIDIGLAIRAERQRRGELPPDPRPFVLLERLAAEGRLGQKTGAGLYAYPAGARRGVPDPEVVRLAFEEAGRIGVARREIDDLEIRDRCLLPLVTEGARLLDEGVAARSSDIDVVWVNGYGFPRWRGGPMWWADSVGLPQIVARLDALASRLGDAFGYWSAPGSLRKRAGAGETLTKNVTSRGN